MKINKINTLMLIGISLICFFSCQSNSKKVLKNMGKQYKPGTFGYDYNYLSKYDSLIILESDDSKSQIIISSKYQAKVFTSTTNGMDSKSLGFVNYKVFEASEIDEHMNGYGGENRFWLGPEGGQYSIYFKPGENQIFENWHTPKAIDTEPWNVDKISNKVATFTKDMKLKNYQDYTLNISVEREISLISNSEIERKLGIDIPENINTVAYMTNNKITNKNSYKWTEKTGTVCIWMLDMFNPSREAITIIPFHEGDDEKLGKVATTNYFGEIPADRLKEKDGFIYFKTDGKYRSKLGMNAKRTKSIVCNYDPLSKRLTFVTFNVSSNKTYLNQEWNIDKDPLIGDALNAYNDGPLDDGSIMGPFFELESCSPAAFLSPEESLTHQHSVFHFVGNESELSLISKKLLGIEINKIKNIF